MQNWEKRVLTPGLYLVATPLGNARDITLRALDLLASADVLVAEDTRSLRKLMEIHGVPPGERPMVAYHEHNGARMRPKLLHWLEEGRAVLYASEAGTPLVADPGFDLVRAARAAGHPVTAAPGPVAAITALSIAGLPTDRFLFEGFLPNASGQRKSALKRLCDVPATLVFYESPKRVAAMLRDAAEVLGPAREARLCRELTKKFEEIRSGTLQELAEGCAQTPPRGEIVVLVDRADSETVNEDDLERLVKEALIDHSVRDAADRISAETGLPRRKVYQLALKLERDTS
ncbi:16S rRNA (cytidine(1402)-2'-O)-methyltransferase [Lutimaribacter sp. EGI FJ00015]|uniref:16S rRNA (Cytidine(1402)-2'-O)-methyltransferase n=1 Tax=Lutimaribacter degradans TaxID=2945989 RepID=A0ACC5ZYT4_9RHOB|nr:16S rRNA (cytidine(1402)-2'-O)-methyltransferase [Lutimaribacter sp. EGI FJ00013]MCO0614689.1 16S rRNA (cytidine(1402)-2'-O)-methyltransferase [Lutimaribacter sp. EGI FJ00015]MCO0637359.1 16S rRNA (cytidine(1402)-2'-O)-methyltransferase [Lutimaribacter sp. EGI FJ00014]